MCKERAQTNPRNRMEPSMLQGRIIGLKGCIGNPGSLWASVYRCSSVAYIVCQDALPGVWSITRPRPGRANSRDLSISLSASATMHRTRS